MEIVTESPAGFVIFCFLSGAACSAFLYFRDIRKGRKRPLVWGLVMFRFLSVTLISFLLLSPLLRLSERILEKPIIIIGVDNSKSMVSAGDSLMNKKELPAQIEALKATLSRNFDVKTYSFGQTLLSGFNATYDESQSDMSTFFNEVVDRYSNRNAAALILISDGIFNKGTDPAYAAEKISFPVYTVGLGDTIQKKDALLRKINVNKVVYRNDKFPVDVLVEMNGYRETPARISILQGAKILDTRQFKAPAEKSALKFRFLQEAKQPGIFRYSIKLDTLSGEQNRGNNQLDFFIEVRDARQKIAIVSNIPHPDIAALKTSLTGSSNYDVTLYSLPEFIKAGIQYDLVVLYQIPSIRGINNLNPLMNSGNSVLFILGTQTDINEFNALKSGLTINGFKNSFTDPAPVSNENFSLFTMSRKDLQIINNFPPLMSPFGSYQFSPVSDILLFQKITTMQTTIPLVMFTNTTGRKAGYVTGENFWRWRISNFMQTGDHETFDRLFEKIVHYLANKEDQQLFRIITRNRIQDTDPIEMEAEVRNASMELINEPDVNIDISDSAGNTYPFTFSKSDKRYFLNAGLFPVGAYSYKASVKVGPETRTQSGRFIIDQTNLEQMVLVADHQLLRRISAAHDADLIERSKLTTLATTLENREDLRSVTYEQIRLKDLIGNPWLFVLILLLLSVEWVIRKREGM